ncbi:MAG: UBP-type zinc finger domain-containing protein [Nocardioides sp.]|jgi:hypothetical protein
MVTYFEDPEAIDEGVEASGTGCLECVREGGWWVHLRRCALCGHIGCCDTSPSQHSTKHWQETGHPIIRSFEPGEVWFYDFRTATAGRGPDLAPPLSRPEDQGVPAPEGRVPENWQDLINR